MKKAIKLSLWPLLALGLLTSCNPENEEEKDSFDSDYTAKSDYTVTAFGLDMKMIYVKGGVFRMGATEEQGDDAYDREYPVRNIRLDGYHIGKYEVTQSQWKAVMGTSLQEQRDKANPIWGFFGKGDDHPMYYVSWEEAQAFCQKLSEATGRKYVLPTEAQWEYAARGGSKSQHYKYAGSNDIDEVAWYIANSSNISHPVGTKKANELGCYDMSGNVMEWCSDWVALYDENDTINPLGPVTGSYRIHRGSSFHWEGSGHRVSSRDGDTATGRFSDMGFRVACVSE